MFDSEDEQVSVAAGIIHKDNKVLICQRAINHRYGLKWEFPGGKPYPDESLSECLQRELGEELDIEPTKYKQLRTLQAKYSDGGNFLITFFLVTEYDGEMKNKVFDNIAWVAVDDLNSYDLLEGSKPIISHLHKVLPS